MFEFLYPKLRIKNYLNKVFQKYEITSDFTLEDEITGEKYSVIDLILDLNERVKTLEEKYDGALQDIKRLEQENIEVTNSLYEIENRIQSQIDNIHPVVYNLKDFTIDK
jgi:predicted  nucleic acid-binding Zn-ribbon protein